MLRFLSGVVAGIYIAEHYKLPKIEAVVKRASQELDKWSKDEESKKTNTKS